VKLFRTCYTSYICFDGKNFLNYTFYQKETVFIQFLFFICGEVVDIGQKSIVRTANSKTAKEWAK
jgi:hypothetical protein